MQGRYRKTHVNATDFSLLKIGSNDLDDVVGGFFRRFRISRHVVSDVVFHQLAHKAVNRASRGGQALQRLGARLVFVEGTKNAFELANDFLGAGDEVELFARGV